MKARRVALATLIAVVVPAMQAAQPAATQLYWGDTHLHTAHSVDAYSTGNYLADPDTAFRYARGLPILHPVTNEKIRIERPLDFLVVADHAELVGVHADAGFQFETIQQCATRKPARSGL
jgi:hypothetical protein